MLRGVLLDGSIAWSAKAETLLHFAARAEHVERDHPAGAGSRDVGGVHDRFADSTLVYAGRGAGADRAAIAALTDMIGLPPDLTLVCWM